MTQSDPLDLTALKATAEAATKGDWYTQETDEYWQLFAVQGEGHPLQLIKAIKHSEEYACYWPGKEDSAHIATFDPPTVLRLIAALEAAQAANLEFGQKWMDAVHSTTKALEQRDAAQAALAAARIEGAIKMQEAAAKVCSAKATYWATNHSRESLARMEDCEMLGDAIAALDPASISAQAKGGER